MERYHVVDAYTKVLKPSVKNCLLNTHRQKCYLSLLLRQNDTILRFLTETTVCVLLGRARETLSKLHAPGTHITEYLPQSCTSR